MSPILITDRHRYFVRHRSNPDRLDVHEFADTMDAELASEAGVLHATERETRIGRDHRVDEHLSRLDAVDEALRFAAVGCPDARAEAERRRVGEADRVGGVLRAEERRDRT